MLQQIALKVIETYFLSVGEAIVKVRAEDDHFIVETNSAWWHVSSFIPSPQFVKSDGYDLIEVCLYVVADPPLQPDGVALVSDDRMFHLNDREGFRNFLRSAPTLTGSLEIASLLTRYQGNSDLGARQNLIVRPEDLAGLLDEKQVGLIEGLVPFTENRESDERLTIDFCTYYIRPEPPDDVLKVGLMRWHVEPDSDGSLSWSCWPIATGLDSPRYAP